MRKCAFFLVSASLLCGGCGEKDPKVSAAQRAGPGDLVVAGRLVTSEEIIEPLVERLKPVARASSFERFKQQAGPEVHATVNDRISYVLLYEQVKKEVGGRIDEGLERGVEQEVRKFLVGFDGDYARAEDYLNQMGMDWESFRQHQRKLMLLSTRMPQPRPITRNELLQTYNAMKDESFAIEGTITLRLIDIQPAGLRSVNPGRDPLAEARELAHDLVRRIRAGEDFGGLAREYSHGHRRDFEGLWKPRCPDSLAKPYDILAAEAEKMLPGQIAGPIEAVGGEHIFIMKLEDKQPRSYKPFEQVQRQIEDRIAFQRRAEAAAEIDAKLARQVPPEQRNRFVDSCLERIYRMSNR